MRGCWWMAAMRLCAALSHHARSPTCSQVAALRYSWTILHTRQRQHPMGRLLVDPRKAHMHRAMDIQYLPLPLPLHPRLMTTQQPSLPNETKTTTSSVRSSVHENLLILSPPSVSSLVFSPSSLFAVTTTCNVNTMYQYIGHWHLYTTHYYHYPHIYIISRT